MKLSVNNILFPPAWWEKNETQLGFYHPKKWRKLIEWDPIFAVEDAFIGTGVDMQKKSGMLNDWLNKNIIIVMKAEWQHNENRACRNLI